MTTRQPLVINGNAIQQLQSGDTLNVGLFDTWAVVTTDQAVTSTTLVDVTGLTWSPTAAANYFLDILFPWSTDSSGRVIKLAIDVSANLTTMNVCMHMAIGQGSTSNRILTTSGVAINGGSGDTFTGTGSPNAYIHAFGPVRLSGAATVKFRAATSAGTFTLLQPFTGRLRQIP